MRENISLTKEGYKTTLLSSLSEYSISIILVAYLISAYYFPIFLRPLNNYKEFSLPLEMKVFLGVLTIMLLHPIGSIVTLTSWVSLGWLEKHEETFHFKYNLFVSRGIRNYLSFDKVAEDLRLTAGNFYKKAREQEHNIYVYHSAKLHVTDWALGTSVLVRNCSFCSLCLVVIHLFLYQYSMAVLMATIFVVLTILNSLASFYYSLYILNISVNLTDGSLHSLKINEVAE
jgi:hypothetical protein